MSAEEVYRKLIAINQSTFAEGDYDTACHALEAAVARAHYLQEAQSLDEIRARAQEQETQLATLPLPERVPHTTDQRRHAFRLILANVIAETSTMSSLIQYERDLAKRRTL